MVSYGITSSSGATRPTARRPQYNSVIRHSIGALATLSRFFRRNSRRERVTSARRATMNVMVERARPMLVRYCKCQPYDLLLCVQSAEGAPPSRRRSGSN
ncbi:hypothetical protein MRB53_039109 [Persea americana]|nr:hypothetical protein MRB53_039109 [Persea americana]